MHATTPKFYSTYFASRMFHEYVHTHNGVWKATADQKMKPKKLTHTHTIKCNTFLHVFFFLPRYIDFYRSNANISGEWNRHQVKREKRRKEWEQSWKRTKKHAQKKNSAILKQARVQIKTTGKITHMKKRRKAKWRRLSEIPMQWAAKISFRYAKVHGLHIIYFLLFFSYFVWAFVLFCFVLLLCVSFRAFLHECACFFSSFFFLLFRTCRDVRMPCKSCLPQSPKTNVHILFYNIFCIHWSLPPSDDLDLRSINEGKMNRSFFEISVTLPNVCGKKQRITKQQHKTNYTKSKEAKKKKSIQTNKTWNITPINKRCALI